MMQAVLVCGAQPSFHLPAPGACLRVSAGEDRQLFFLNTQADETDCIVSYLKENRDLYSRASLSRCHPVHSNVQKVTAEAENNLLDAFVDPEAFIFPYREPQYALLDERENLFGSLIRQNRVQQIRSIVLDTPSYFAAHQMGARDAVYLWNRIATRTGHLPDLTALEHLEIYEMVERFGDIREMSLFMADLYWPAPSARRNTAGVQFARMLEYIHTHYTEKMELEELCERFFISPSYASALFRQETDTSFSRYVTELRIRYACDVLVQFPQLTIAEVGEMAGYRDYFYFAKVFRRAKGCTPSEYRRMQGLETEGTAEEEKRDSRAEMDETGCGPDADGSAGQPVS